MAEKDYIDREALIRYAEKQEVIIVDGTSVAEAMRIQGNVFRRCVEVAPAVDAVEVIRCKDCEYWDAVKNPKHAGTGICTPPNRSLGGYCTRRGATKAEDFCSQAKRRVR